MDDLYALDGGGAAARWQRRHQKRKARALKDRAKRRALDAAERNYDDRKAARAARRRVKAQAAKKEERRKARIARIEVAERAAWRTSRKREGYVNPDLPYKDITGQRFGLLVAVRPAPRIHGSRNKAWLMQCDCGSPLKAVRATNLKLGGTRSCGCYGRGDLRERWHKPEVVRRKKIKMMMTEKERNRPLSYKLRKLILRARKQLPLSKADVKILSEARLLALKDELARGQIKARKSWKTDKYLKLRAAA